MIEEDEGSTSRIRAFTPARLVTDRPARRFRRGVYLLPSMFTLANMFCGYACIVYAMRGELERAAPLIGFAIIVDMLDGRVARINIQTGTVDKKFFVGLPSPAAAAVPATTIYFYPEGFQSPIAALAVLALVIVPGLLMVSTVRFYSFKTLDLQSRRAYPVLALLALGLALLTAHEIMLVVLSYAYMASG